MGALPKDGAAPETSRRRGLITLREEVALDMASAVRRRVEVRGSTKDLQRDQGAMAAVRSD